MDLATIARFPFLDDSWMPKVLPIGLISLIPIVGQLNLAGWLAATYRNITAGKRELPKGDLSYIGDGVKVAVAVLPAILLPLAANSPLGWFVQTLFALAGLAAMATAPAMIFIHLHDGVATPWLKLARMSRVITAGGFRPYAMMWVVFLLSGMVGSLGYALCYVGSAATLPIAAAVQAAAVAQYKLGLAGVVEAERLAEEQRAAEEAAEEKARADREAAKRARQEGD
jgi:hypothetical protein